MIRIWMACICPTVALAAQDETDKARRIVDAARESLAALQAVSYDFERSGLGDHALLGNNYVGHVKYQRDGDTLLFYRMRDYAPGTRPRPCPIITATDGRHGYTLHHKDKILIYRDWNPDIDSAARGSQVEFEPAYLSPRLLDLLLGPRDLTVEARQRVNGVLCDVVRLDMDPQPPPRGTHFWWFFGVEDHLPRAVKRYQSVRMENEEERGFGYMVKVRNLKANPTIPREVFTLKAPEGYVVDQQQPPRPPSMEPPRLPATPSWAVRTPDGAIVPLADLGDQAMAFLLGNPGEDDYQAAKGHLAEAQQRLGRGLLQIFAVPYGFEGSGGDDPEDGEDAGSWSDGVDLLMGDQSLAELYESQGSDIAVIFVFRPDGSPVPAMIRYHGVRSLPPDQRDRGLETIKWMLDAALEDAFKEARQPSIFDSPHDRDD